MGAIGKKFEKTTISQFSYHRDSNHNRTHLGIQARKMREKQSRSKVTDEEQEFGHLSDSDSSSDHLWFSRTDKISKKEVLKNQSEFGKNVEGISQGGDDVDEGYVSSSSNSSSYGSISTTNSARSYSPSTSLWVSNNSPHQSFL